MTAAGNGAAMGSVDLSLLEGGKLGVKLAIMANAPGDLRLHSSALYLSVKK